MWPNLLHTRGAPCLGHYLVVFCFFFSFKAEHFPQRSTLHEVKFWRHVLVIKQHCSAKKGRDYSQINHLKIFPPYIWAHHSLHTFLEPEQSTKFQIPSTALLSWSSLKQTLIHSCISVGPLPGSLYLIPFFLMLWHSWPTECRLRLRYIYIYICFFKRRQIRYHGSLPC